MSDDSHLSHTSEQESMSDVKASPTFSKSSKPSHSSRTVASGILNQRALTVLLWTLATIACAWIALCTAVGPIYRKNSSIVTMSWGQFVRGIATFLVCMAIVYMLTVLSKPEHPVGVKSVQLWKKYITTQLCTLHEKHSGIKPIISQISTYIVLATNRWWKIAVILGAVWGMQFFFVPTIFAADLNSQHQEMIRWIQAITGSQVPYADGFSIVDVYPIAHYMWPDTPTYLTNQHNIALTFLYGGALRVSELTTGSIDLGLIVLSAMQLLFAVLTISITMHRFFSYAMPIRPFTPSAQTDDTTLLYCRRQSTPAWARVGIVLFFAFNPLSIFSTTALTKSPLFAFAFVWWFGQWYEIFASPRNFRMNRRLILGMAVSTSIMLISAKYASYILILHILLVFIADRRRWKAYLISLVLPFIVFQLGLNALVNSGSIISGDPIESYGIQIQQIARVMNKDPLGVSEDVQNRLRPIFNLYAMGASYNPNDADRVKSSGSDGKIETYKWQTVTKEDMSAFVSAWIALGRNHPVEYADAFIAKTYGYFDVTDEAYVPTRYYVNNSRLSRTQYIKNWFPEVRKMEVEWADKASKDPVLKYFTQGNFYVVMVLLLICATGLLRRWKDLLRYMPLVLLMGVMIMAPANNFERHMLPLAFVAWFMLLDFAHHAVQAYRRAYESRVM